MEAKIPTSGRWDLGVPPRIVEWTIGFVEFVRALLRGDRTGSQGWPLISEYWEEDY